MAGTNPGDAAGGGQMKCGSTRKNFRGSGMGCRRESTTLGGWPQGSEAVKGTMHREREAVPVFIENGWKPEPKEFEEILNNKLKLRTTSGNGREAAHHFELM